LETFSIKGGFCPTKVPGPPAKVYGPTKGLYWRREGAEGMDWGDRVKTKPPRVFCFRGGKFFVRVNDRFSGSSRDHGWDGIIWTDFTFPKVFFCPWHLLSLSDLDFNMFLGFGRGICTTVYQIPVNRFSSDGRISMGFHGSMDLGFSDLGALRVFPGFSDCTTVFQVFG
jgi:hypothetical protein